MSESRDEATGQFSSAEPLFGEAGIEHDAGYVPMPDEKKDDELTVAEAVDSYVSRTPEADIKTYSAISDLPDNMTMTLEQGAQALTDMREADAAQEEQEDSERIRAEVDELRGVKPDAGQAEAKIEAPGAVKDGEIDPEIEKALSNPQVKAAIEQQIGETEQARQNYLTGLTAATQIAQAAFVSQFPEWANVPEDQRANVLAAIQQHNPERFAQIHAAVANSQRLFQQHGIEQQRQAQEKQAKFQSYAKGEDARFADMMKGERNMPAIEAEIPAMLKSVGVDPVEFLKAGSESSFLRSAAAQAVLVKAAKYDMLMKAPKAVAAKLVPQVQRPGTARASGSSLSGQIQALTRQLETTGDIKVAEKLYELQQRRAS